MASAGEGDAADGTGPFGGQPFERVGTRLAETIPVRISYRIIELFSGHLYSSPHKAIEELISNSYDAGATEVDLILPNNLRDADATIWVVDNGESMDLDGLKALWQIGRSPKKGFRDDVGDDKRKPIGKFGIGKLATYVVASRLTYVCRQDGELLAVTMNYGDIDQDSDTEHQVDLVVRRLTSEETAEALAPMRSQPGGAALADRLLASEESWTAAAMSSLRPDASNIKYGRLEWLLSTALPASPAFVLRMQGKRVKGKVAETEPFEQWTIGDNASVGRTATAIPDPDDGGPRVEVEALPGSVVGTVEIYDDVLTRNKAGEWGRSHGFFVRVRGRLVNLDDALFGNKALSHAVFNRFKMVVDADGLDAFLTSTRESVQDAPAVENFRAYLRSEFYAAAAIYTKHLDQREQEGRIGARIGGTAASLSRQPLVSLVRKLIDGELEHALLTERPDVDDGEDLLERLETSLLETKEGPITDVIPEPIGATNFIARYDPKTGVVAVNILHPFVANFIDTSKDSTPFDLIAVAEVLTEAYLYEEGIDPEAVDRIMRRRDEFLRELVSERRVGPAVIAQNLVDMEEDADGLEGALHECFRSLGFEVTPMGKSGKPEGRATADLGFGAAGTDDSYSFTYDAKSTKNKRVAAKTVGVSTLVRHRNNEARAGVKFAVVVAKDFAGADDREHALGQECVEHGVTPIKVRDLAALVEIAAARGIGPRRLRDLLETCRSPKESHEWVQALLEEPEEDFPPLQEVLDAIVTWRAQSSDQITLGNVETVLKMKHDITTTKAELAGWIGSIVTLAPRRITLIGDVVILETSPERVLEALASHYQALDSRYRADPLDRWLGEKS